MHFGMQIFCLMHGLKQSIYPDSVNVRKKRLIRQHPLPKIILDTVRHLRSIEIFAKIVNNVQSLTIFKKQGLEGPINSFRNAHLHFFMQFANCLSRKI